MYPNKAARPVDTTSFRNRIHQILVSGLLAMDQSDVPDNDTTQHEVGGSSLGYTVPQLESTVHGRVWTKVRDLYEQLQSLGHYGVWSSPHFGGVCDIEPNNKMPLR